MNETIAQASTVTPTSSQAGLGFGPIVGAIVVGIALVAI
jgi:hypothetical protein